MEKTYIFGHKNPDTDSVTASIAFSYLKNQLKENTVPMVLGEINKETKYVLDYFGVKQPEFLNDVKLQIKDIKYKKGIYFEENESIYNTYYYMMDQNLSTIPIVDKDKKMLGIVSMKDIAKNQLSNSTDKLNTSFNNIVETLNGKEILKFDDEIKGNINVALLRSTTFIQNIKLDSDSILIVGDRHSIIEYAVNSGVKLIVVIGNGKMKEDIVKIVFMIKLSLIDFFFIYLNIPLRHVLLALFLLSTQTIHESLFISYFLYFSVAAFWQILYNLLFFRFFNLT